MRSSIMLITGAILAGAITQPAHADSKDEFKKGCESSRPPGSFVENVDNVQCNTSAGVMITCDKSIKQCGVASLGPVKPCTPGISYHLERPTEILGLNCQPLVVGGRAAPSEMDQTDPLNPAISGPAGGIAR